MTVTTDTGQQDCSSESWSLWLAAGSGRLYHIDESKLSQKASSPSSLAGSAAMEVDDGHDIFDDLLATQAAHISTESQSDERVIILRHSHAVYKLSNEILSLCSVQNLLFVAHYLDEKYYSIVGYRKLDMLSHTARDDLKYVVKYEASYDSVRVSSAVNNTENISMYCVESNVQIQEMHNSDTITISATLFGHLFGADTSLMNSAVLLFALPNGIMHFFILKSIINDSSSYILHSKFPDILCDGKSHIVNVHALCLPAATTRQTTSDIDFSMLYNIDDVTNQEDVSNLREPNVLLIVSQSGRCVLIQERDTSSPHYHTIHLMDGIKCTLSNDRELFCSFTHTCNGIQRVVFETSVDVSNTLSWWPRYRNWNVVGVDGMSFVSQQMNGGGDSDAHPALVLCCTRSGRMFTIDSSAPRDIVRAGQQTSGQKMKDLLTSISNTSSKIDTAHKELERLQKILSQISIACHMLAAYMQSVDCSAVTAKFLACDTHVKCMIHGSGNRREYSIVSKITNISKAVLSADWSCVVQCTHYHDLERKQPMDTRSKILSFSQEFRPDAWEDIIIPLNTCTEHLTCPVFTVSTSLLYHVGAAVNRDFIATSLETSLDFTTHVLTIPLNESRIDLIHFICDQTLGSSSYVFDTHDVPAVLPNCNLSQISTSDLVMSMARCRPSYLFHQEKLKTNSSRSKSRDIQTLTIRMPDLMNRHAKSGLLPVLLSESQLAASTLSESSMKLLAPNGHYIQLELAADNTLTLRSTDMLNLVQLRHALVTRIENLKQSSSVISRSVPADKSRKSIEKIQALQQSLLDVMQVAAAKAPTDRAESVLLHGLKIYHRLRDINLS